MSLTAIDSLITAPLLTDAATAAQFQDAAVIHAMLEVEGALALAEADCGLIPEDAGTAIWAASAKTMIEPAALADGTAKDGVPVPALVAALRKAVGDPHGQFVHWGATSQDIADTGLVLRLRKAVDLQEASLRKLASSLAGLAADHRQTPLAARTRMQQATPTSFGLKAAAWLCAVLRHLDRLPAIRERLLVLSFGGASGNLAALGEKALEVETALARRLKLSVPAAPWHTARDSLIDYANWLTLVTGTLGKIGTDIILLSQNEVAELRPGSGGGSSTMPNKVNPVAAELMVALARQNATLLSSMHQAALQDHERSGAAWTLEWLTLPQMVIGTGAALTHGTAMMSELTVNADRMRANIDASNGLLLAEAASFALADHMPRPEAQALVKEACKTAVSENRHLFDVLSETTGTSVDWETLKNPARHMGASDAMIDRVLESYQRFKG